MASGTSWAQQFRAVWAGSGRALRSSKAVGASAKTVYKAKASETAIKLPNGVKLLPDAEYSWTVKMAGAEVGAGTFKTLSAHSLELIQRRKPGDKAEFSDWLLMFTVLIWLTKRQYILMF